MYILGIETSCDDTSIAILKNNTVLSCITRNNSKQLDPYGGIVPEIVARFHENNIINTFNDVLKEAKIIPKHINKIAYTSTPGLPGSLMIGEIFAKTLGFVLDIEVIPINHIHGHILSPFINSNPIYPFLSLIASGKTTSIFLIKDANNIIELTKTLDDAVGESFDKIGKALGYSYPGGKNLDLNFDIKKATLNFSFPNINNDFSFSGIKSKFLNIIKKQKSTIDSITIGSSYIKYCVDLIIRKLKYYQNLYQINTITIGGGVASNSYFKSEIKKIFTNSYVPNIEYACDNAAMIAYAYYQKIT